MSRLFGVQPDPTMCVGSFGAIVKIYKKHFMFIIFTPNKEGLLLNSPVVVAWDQQGLPRVLDKRDYFRSVP